LNSSKKDNFQKIKIHKIITLNKNTLNKSSFYLGRSKDKLGYQFRKINFLNVIKRTFSSNLSESELNGRFRCSSNNRIMNFSNITDLASGLTFYGKIKSVVYNPKGIAFTKNNFISKNTILLIKAHFSKTNFEAKTKILYAIVTNEPTNDNLINSILISYV